MSLFYMKRILHFTSLCWPPSLDRSRSDAVRLSSAVPWILLLAFISVDATGFEAGKQLYPDQKWGLEFDIVSKYSDTSKLHDISVLVDRKGKLRKLEKLQLLILTEQESTLLDIDDLNIRSYREKLTVNGKLVQRFTGAKFRIKQEYLEGARLRLELPGFVYIARLKDFVHARKE